MNIPTANFNQNLLKKNENPNKKLSDQLFSFKKEFEDEKPHGDQSMKIDDFED